MIRTVHTVLGIRGGRALYPVQRGVAASRKSVTSVASARSQKNTKMTEASKLSTGPKFYHHTLFLFLEFPFPFPIFFIKKPSNYIIYNILIIKTSRERRSTTSSLCMTTWQRAELRRWYSNAQLPNAATNCWATMRALELTPIFMYEISESISSRKVMIKSTSLCLYSSSRWSCVTRKLRE